MCFPGSFPKRDDSGELTTMIFAIALLLTLAGIAGFPCWRYSRTLGYGPSLSAGILLVLVALLAIGHKGAAPAMAGPTTTHEVKVATAPAAIRSLIVDPSRQPIPLRRRAAETSSD